MRVFKMAFLAAVALTIAASAPQTQQRKFVITDLTTNDASMSTPRSSHIAPVPCSDDTLYVAFKCAGADDSTYQKVSGDSLDLVCSSESSGIKWRNNFDTDYNGTIAWECSLSTVQELAPNAKSSWQIVSISGQLSLCREDDNLTTQTSCGVGY